MIDPKEYSPRLQARREAGPAEARAQRWQASFVSHTWNRFRIQEALAAMEDRRLAARSRILSELSRIDCTH